MVGEALAMRGGRSMLNRDKDYLEVLLVLGLADLAVLAGGADSGHHLG